MTIRMSAPGRKADIPDPLAVVRPKADVLVRAFTRIPGASPAVNGIRATQGNSIVALYLPAASVSLKNASDV